MRSRNGANTRKTQADAARVATARAFRAKEGLERLAQVIGGPARALLAYFDDRHALFDPNGQVRLPTIF